MLLGCGYQRSDEIIDSPDGNVSLIIQTGMDGGAAGSIVYEIYIEGMDPQRPAFLGVYFDARRSPIRWVDATTVNVCALKGESEVVHAADVVGWDSIRRTYHLTTDCSDESPLPPDEPAPPTPAPEAKG
jgi:hypothetical protein